MTDEIRILLVEDEEDVCGIYQKMLYQNNKMKLIGITGSENEALQLMDRERVDAIILDLELQEGDGMSFLFELEDSLQKQACKPLIFVVTNNSSRIIWQTALDNGVDFVIPKMNAQYSPALVLSKLEKAYPYYVRRESASTVLHDRRTDDSPEMYAKIKQYLKNMGMDGSRRGLEYLTEALLIAMQRVDFGNIHMTNHIYSAIAGKYQVSIESVEKDIHRVVEASWKNIDAAVLAEYAPYTRPKDGEKPPTNAEFVLTVARHLKA